MVTEGLRGAWIERSWPADTRDITRWFALVASAELNGCSEFLCCCVLGWDDSKLPEWVAPRRKGRVAVHVEQREGATIDQALGGSEHMPVEEVRRTELPLSAWNGHVTAQTWRMDVPLVAYEAWCKDEDHAKALAAARELDSSEFDELGAFAQWPGYLGSTILLLPQKRSFFHDVHDFVVVGGHKKAEGLLLISEVLDGSTVLARSCYRLVLEPWRQLADTEALSFLCLRYAQATFADMMAAAQAKEIAAIARYPRQAHGRSGSDLRLTMCVGEAEADSVAVGLIRGSGYLTHEPWRSRAPEIGFSGPARTTHVPPDPEARQAVFERLRAVGAPVWICDPYAEAPELERFAPVLRGGRVLTVRKGLDKRGITPAWVAMNGFELRVASKLHDRFLGGSSKAFMIGASLNGIGKQHSFVTEVDSVIHRQLREVFELLWSSSVAQ